MPQVSSFRPANGLLPPNPMLAKYRNGLVVVSASPRLPNSPHERVGLVGSTYSAWSKLYASDHDPLRVGVATFGRSVVTIVNRSRTAYVRVLYEPKIPWWPGRPKNFV